jgi:exodeoxyribonuclease VII large subunit
MAAAELVVLVLVEVLAALDSAQRRLSQAVRREIRAMRQRADATARMAWFRDPVGILRRRSLGLDDVAGRLRLALTRMVARRLARTQAAELAIARNRPEVQIARRLARLGATEYRLSHSLMVLLRRKERQSNLACGRLAERSPRRRVDRAKVSLDHLSGDMSRVMREALAGHRNKLDALAARLDAASHERVLGRGFTITRQKRGGRIVKHRDEVKQGDRIETETVDGRFTSRVDDDRQAQLFDE